MLPAAGPRRRFATWFFVCRAPEGDIAIDHGEIHDHQWATAEHALSQHRDGEIEIVPPTWISLWQIGQHESIDAAEQLSLIHI